MKISDNMIGIVLIISIATVFIIAIVTEGNNDPIVTKIISHAEHGDGYQLVDNVNQRICAIYPDALESGDRLDCLASME